MPETETGLVFGAARADILAHRRSWLRVGAAVTTSLPRTLSARVTGHAPVVGVIDFVDAG